MLVLVLPRLLSLKLGHLRHGFTFLSEFGLAVSESTEVSMLTLFVLAQRRLVLEHEKFLWRMLKFLGLRNVDGVLLLL